MRFLPRADLLSLDELERLSAAFIRKGVKKIRLTGGEPLMRRGIIGFAEKLAARLDSGALDELTLTTNGSRLAEFADGLAALGINRINVSLDTLDEATYAKITRGGRLTAVLAGVDAAQAAGIAVKINTVALADGNRGEWVQLAEWAHARAAAITFIEVMPMGEIEADRIDQFVPLTEVRRELERRWSLSEAVVSTGGPARYVTTDEGGEIGFITPLSRNFCGGCNRVRVTCTGQLFLCLGRDASADLRTPLRASDDDTLVNAAIDAAIARKPERHDFRIAAREAAPAVERHMAMTGG
jgi:cyclic pyranopterin phosphate synthase